MFTGSSDITVRDIVFNPSVTEMGLQIEVQDSFVTKVRKEFNVSLATIKETNGTGVIKSLGDPAKIIVYDKDCKLLQTF